MKLSDINIITQAKVDYDKTKAKLQGVRGNAIHNVSFYNIGDPALSHELKEQVKVIIVRSIEHELHELTAKLTMLGVTDFES